MNKQEEIYYRVYDENNNLILQTSDKTTLKYYKGFKIKEYRPKSNLIIDISKEIENE